MSGLKALRIGLVALGCAGLIAAAWAGTRPIAAGPLPQPSVLGAPGSAHSGPTALDSLAELAVSRPPMRASRRPAAVPFDPVQPATGEAGVPVSAPVERPRLILTGILWGREPVAVVEGLPGTDGPRVVRPGDRLGDLRVGRITQERVVVAGQDTLWNLNIRTAW